MGREKKHLIKFPLGIYGLAAGALFVFQFSPVKNFLTIGGGALIGFGIGSFFNPIAGIIINKFYIELFQKKVVSKGIQIALGFISAEIINIIIILLGLIFESAIRERIIANGGFEDLLVRIHIPVVFWVMYLWHKTYPIQIKKEVKKSKEVLKKVDETKVHCRYCGKPLHPTELNDQGLCSPCREIVECKNKRCKIKIYRYVSNEFDGYCKKCYLSPSHKVVKLLLIGMGMVLFSSLLMIGLDDSYLGHILGDKIIGIIGIILFFVGIIGGAGIAFGISGVIHLQKLGKTKKLEEKGLLISAKNE